MMHLLALGGKFQSFGQTAALICGKNIYISIGLQNILRFLLLF